MIRTTIWHNVLLSDIIVHFVYEASFNIVPYSGPYHLIPGTILLVSFVVGYGM